MGIELSEDERWALLDDKMVMRLATVDPAGRPHVVPIWYLANREFGNVYFSTPQDTRKARDIAETPTVSLTVDEGSYYFELRSVVVEGEASVVEAGDERDTVEEAWCRKYFGEAERPDFIHLLYEGRPWDWYRVEPDNWISWDNTRIDIERLRERRG